MAQKPHIKVKPGQRGPKVGRTRQERSRNAVLTAEDRKRTGATAVTFNEIPADRWERAFGKKSPEQLRAEREAYRREQAEKKQHEAEVQGQAFAVHGENKGAGRRLFKPGTFDIGLGTVIRGRTHRNEIMRSLGLRERA